MPVGTVLSGVRPWFGDRTRPSRAPGAPRIRSAVDLDGASPSQRFAWQDDAACRDWPELFFAPDTERVRERDRREDQAREVCAACPVRARCLEHALSVPEPFGMWGGTTEDDRKEAAALLRRRRVPVSVAALAALLRDTGKPPVAQEVSGV